MFWGGRTLTLETGKIARQADGAVVATYGETKVLCTVPSAKSPKSRGIDFFPLTVNYQEKTYAAGKIPGGFFKREGRPSEKETLTSRLIDRPIRPLFAGLQERDAGHLHRAEPRSGKRSRHIVGHDRRLGGADHFRPAVPGPDRRRRVGYIDGEYVLNPTIDQMEESALDLIVAGTQDGVLMVESEANELDPRTPCWRGHVRPPQNSSR
jgi:polyribonucleotide nucleotidyltransferase